MAKPAFSAFIALLTIFGKYEVAQAWGERGHDLIARVAARVLSERDAGALGGVFATKEHMLGHLANVPDIVWRSSGGDTEAQNGPTHYIDLDYFALTPTIRTLPSSLAEASAALKSLCAKPPPGYRCPASQNHQLNMVLVAGTAPFRVEQLFNLQVQAFDRVRAASTRDAQTRAVNQALLYAGLLAHFIGDLAQPYHTTRDYNGVSTQQTGLHSYYETEIVNALPLSMDHEVYEQALKEQHLSRIKRQLTPGELGQPLLVAYALAIDSFSRIKDVASLDRKYAVLRPASSDHGLELKATRRPAKEVAGHFQSLTVERLSLAADLLAKLWFLAWEKGGKPDLSAYQSYDYQLAPAFVAAP